MARGADLENDKAIIIIFVFKASIYDRSSITDRHNAEWRKSMEAYMQKYETGIRCDSCSDILIQ